MGGCISGRSGRAKPPPAGDMAPLNSAAQRARVRDGATRQSVPGQNQQAEKVRGAFHRQKPAQPIAPLDAVQAPRLAAADIRRMLLETAGHGADDGPRCLNHQPDFIEVEPSEEHSRELMQFADGQWGTASPRKPEGVEFVPQSEGRVSSRKMASVGFYTCMAFIARASLPKPVSHFHHHDAGYRHGWEGGDPSRPPASGPCTPERGLMGRERGNLEEFSKLQAEKFGVAISLHFAHDKRPVSRMYESLGVTMIPPIVIQARPGADPKKTRLNVLHDPATGTVVVHYRDEEVSRVFHFTNLLSRRKQGPLLGQYAAANVPATDIGARPDEFRKRIRDARGLDDTVIDALDLCTSVIELREYDPAGAKAARAQLLRTPNLPGHLLAELETWPSLGTPMGCGFDRALTGLAEWLLQRPPGQPLQPAARLPGLPDPRIELDQALAELGHHALWNRLAVGDPCSRVVNSLTRMNGLLKNEQSDLHFQPLMHAYRDVIAAAKEAAAPGRPAQKPKVQEALDRASRAAAVCLAELGGNPDPSICVKRVWFEQTILLVAARARLFADRSNERIVMNRLAEIAEQYESLDDTPEATRSAEAVAIRGQLKTLAKAVSAASR